MGQKRGEEEREEAKKEVMQMTIHKRAQELATTMKASVPLQNGEHCVHRCWATTLFSFISVCEDNLCSNTNCSGN